MRDTLSADIAAIRNTRPLIHSITNFVVMNTTANALLAIGASPIMAHAVEELSELIAISNALVINIGTLDLQWKNSFLIAAGLATKKKMPIVLDPVGAGASQLRTHTALEILNNAEITVIRGNASEILALFNSAHATRGVDSRYKSDDAITAAKNLSQQFNCIVVISGIIDYCVFLDDMIAIEHGSPMMQCVTGMGCTATAIIAAFLSVNKNSLLASAHAMTCMGICGEIAATNSKGPGTFFPQFLDALYHYA